MNPDEFRRLLPDFLAGELDEELADAVRQHLRASPADREEVESLQAVAASMARELVTLEDARRRTAALRFPARALARNGARGGFVARFAARALTPALRYAAVVLLAFAAGYLSRSAATGPASETATPPVAVEVRGFDGSAHAARAPTWGSDRLPSPLAERIAHMAMHHPNADALTVAMLSLAAP